MRLKRRRNRSRTGRRKPIARRYKIAALLLCGALLGTIGGTYAAFTAKTVTGASVISAATVGLTNNSGGAPMFNLTGMKPSDAAVTKCITITNSSSVPVSVALFGVWGSGSTTLPDYLNLKIRRGNDITQPFPFCSGFTPDGTNYIGKGNGVVYDGTVGSMPTDFANPGSLIADPPSGPAESWSVGESHDYELTVSLKNNAAAQGLSVVWAFAWGTQNE